MSYHVETTGHNDTRYIVTGSQSLVPFPNEALDWLKSQKGSHDLPETLTQLSGHE